MPRRRRKSSAERFAEKAVQGETIIGEMERDRPELEGNLRVDATGRGATIETDGYVDDDVFGAFRDASRNNRAVSSGGSGGNDVYESRVNTDDGPPNPFDVHDDRSSYAQAQDEARDAKITTSPRKYASDPNSLDFPGVDTGPDFQGTFGEDPSSRDLDKVQKSVWGERESGSLSDLF